MGGSIKGQTQWSQPPIRHTLQGHACIRDISCSCKADLRRLHGALDPDLHLSRAQGFRRRPRRPRGFDPLRRVMSSPGIEPGLRPSQSRVRVRHTPRTRKTSLLPSPHPRIEPGPAASKTAVRPPHSRGNNQCPCQESNLVFDLRGVACRPSHAKGAAEADGRARTGMILLTRQGPHRSATSAGAGAQGFEPCLRDLEARCSPRSTPLSIAPAPAGAEDNSGRYERRLAGEEMKSLA